MREDTYNRVRDYLCDPPASAESETERLLTKMVHRLASEPEVAVGRVLAILERQGRHITDIRLVLGGSDRIAQLEEELVIARRAEALDFDIFEECCHAAGYTSVEAICALCNVKPITLLRWKQDIGRVPALMFYRLFQAPTLAPPPPPPNRLRHRSGLRPILAEKFRQAVLQQIAAGEPWIRIQPTLEPILREAGLKPSPRLDVMVADQFVLAHPEHAGRLRRRRNRRPIPLSG
jgi:hypothetical protein